MKSFGRDLPLTAMLTPEEMHEIVNSVASQPGYTTPFEVVHSGITGGRLPAGRSYMVGRKDSTRTLGKLD